MYIKGTFADLCVIKQTTKRKKIRSSSENALTEHKKTCLKINGKQSIKLKSGSVGFKNYFK